jgi:hypothetical protein
MFHVKQKYANVEKPAHLAAGFSILILQSPGDAATL